jgi:hypothetical protein
MMEKNEKKQSKFRLIVKARRVYFPTFRWPRILTPAIKNVLPRIGLPKLVSMNVAGKVKWIILGTTAVSLSAVSVGIVFSVKDVIKNTYEYPAAGANYTELGSGGTLGQPLPDYTGNDEGEPQGQNQTLQLTLAAGARLSSLSFTGVDAGRTGLTDCLVVERDASNTTGYLFANTMTLTGVSAPSFDMANSEFGTLTTAGVTDGHTWSPTLDSTISEQVVTSSRGSGSFSATDTVVDRVIITLLGDATVETLSYNNVKCSVGGVNFDYIKAGTFTQDSTSKFGDGDGIDTADWVLNTSVKYRTGSDAIVEQPITVR